MIDLTPAAIGPYCIPPVNLQEHIGTREMNVNMVTCGGQATIPMVAAVSRVQPVEYAEIVATVASQVGRPRYAPEHRRVHADDRGRRRAIGGAKRGKAIIIINPAEPPLIMRDTIHCLTVGEPDERPSPPRSTRWSRGAALRARLHAEERPGVRRPPRQRVHGSVRGSATTCRSTPATSTS